MRKTQEMVIDDLRSGRRFWWFGDCITRDVRTGVLAAKKDRPGDAAGRPVAMVPGRSGRGEAMSQEGFPYLVVELPLPPPELHPNARPHRMAKAIATKTARRWAKLAFLAAYRRQGLATRDEVAWRATYRFETRRTRDEDGLNSQLKAYRDGSADALIVYNDKGILRTEIREEEKTGRPRVVIEVFDV